MAGPFRFVMCLSLLLAATGAGAQIYKWTDADGQVHFTQEPPPPGVEGQQVKPPPAPVDSADEEERIKALQEGLQERRDQRLEAAEIARAEADQRREKKEKCALARKRLEQAQYPRVTFIDPDGTQRRATEEERMQQIREAEQQVQGFCN